MSEGLSLPSADRPTRASKGGRRSAGVALVRTRALHVGLAAWFASSRASTAQRVRPIPNVSRALTVGYSSGSFRRRLSSSPSRRACSANKAVSVWKKVGTVGGSDDVKLGQDATSSTGAYVVPRTRRTGSYYAKVAKQTVATAGNCLLARSAVVTLR